jgi:hypothetical protein
MLIYLSHVTNNDELNIETNMKIKVTEFFIEELRNSYKT